MDKECLERILSNLDSNHPFKERFTSYVDECKRNAGFEAVCIGVCELGEFTAEVASYTLSLPHMNELGLFGGTALGGAYAIYHTLHHGKKHTAHASLRDAVMYAGSTESACVISATGTEYLAGKFASIPNNPFDRTNVEMRVGALPIAFGLGLALMSILTYKKQDEAGRCIAAKDILSVRNDCLTKNIPVAYPIKMTNHTLTVLGKHGEMIIKERKLPKTYHHLYNEADHSLYTIHSPICRYHPELKECMSDFMMQSFVDAGLKAWKTEEIFAHK